MPSAASRWPEQVSPYDGPGGTTFLFDSLQGSYGGVEYPPGVVLRFPFPEGAICDERRFLPPVTEELALQEGAE